jgi:hypothetical protein
MPAVDFYENPEYVAKYPDWVKYRDLFEGKHHVLAQSTNYLWPHELEFSTRRVSEHENLTVGEKLRSLRARRSRYLNMMEPVVSTYIGLLFNGGISFDKEVQSLLGDDINDIDGQGTSFENFIKDSVSKSYFLYGQPIILVDAPANDALSLQEQQLLGFRPYMDTLDILSVKDWQVDKAGYTALRYEYDLLSVRQSLQEEPKLIRYCKEFTLDGSSFIVRVYSQDNDKKWQLVDERVIAGWSTLPISSVFNNESWVKDVADLNLVLFNLMSAYYNQLNSQAFQRIFISGESLGDKYQMAISEFTAVVLPGNVAINVVEPSNMQSLTDASDRTIDNIYRVAFNRSKSLAVSSKESPSADAAREQSVELNALLKQAASEIEACVNNAIKDYAKYKTGVEDFQGGISIKTDFSSADFDEQMNIWLTHRDEIKKVLPWKKAYLKRVAEEQEFPEEEEGEIVEAIDKLKEEPNPMDIMRRSGIVAPNGKAPANDAEDGTEDGDNLPPTK